MSQCKESHSFHGEIPEVLEAEGSPSKSRSKGLGRMARDAAALPAGNGMLGVVWFRKIPFGFY